MTNVWTTQSQKLPDEDGLKFTVDFGMRPATFADVLSAWRFDADFCELFTAVLADAPYKAFRWETPAITRGTMTRQPFEFVLLDSPELLRRPNPKTFAEHFARRVKVAVFENKSGDAILVAPRRLPSPPISAYGHLAAFVRQAPAPQQEVLWRTVGKAMESRVENRPDSPVWLSTHGDGVPWLHVRLDDRPKYYGHALYRRTPPMRLEGRTPNDSNR